MRIGCQGNYIRRAARRQRGVNTIVSTKALQLQVGIDIKLWFTVDTLGLPFLRH